MRAASVASLAGLLACMAASAEAKPLTPEEVCDYIYNESLEGEYPYKQDCRMEELSAGYMIELFRGDAAFSKAYSCESIFLLPGENMWADTTRGGLYLFGLLYCFLGIAIVADVFMNAIETITSKEVEKEIVNEKGEVEVVKEKFWNGTVANLTLMALGSSAPEILLSVLGVVSDLGGEADALGPGTIVGSAAFNLLVITSVCIVAPCPETRTVEQFGVYQCTAFFSIEAYVWLLLIIDFISPEVIELWEAVVTFLHFPVLVFLAYGQDRRWDFSSDNHEEHAANSLEYRMNAVRLLSGAPRINFVRKSQPVIVEEVEEDVQTTDAHGYSSDPYCKVTYDGVLHKTKWKKKSLNPKWKEVFGWTFKDNVTKLNIEVYDHDELSSDDFMGKASVEMEISTEPVDVEVKLLDKHNKGGDFGTVHIQHYVSKNTGELIVRVQEGKNLLALEKGNAAMDAVASALGAQMRAVQHMYAQVQLFMSDLMAGYKIQFITAMTMAGPIDEEGVEQPPESLDLLMHALTIFWKVFFALIPPAEFCVGWLAFGIALMFIGGVTMVVGDLATLFGCVVGLEDATTAITFVALGTSLPDMFASKLAAVNEETADNAVGNVTGSNGVNVYLGIGLPWTIATVYAELTDSVFVARSNGFGLSVLVFLAFAVLFIGLLFYRRLMYGGELGGPSGAANFHAGIAIGMWFTYILFSSFVHYEHIDSAILWDVLKTSEAPPVSPPPSPWFWLSPPPAFEDA